MRRFLPVTLLVAFAAATLWAADAAKVLDSATGVVQNMTSGTQIPSSVLHQAQCVAVIPQLTKAGLIIGGEHGSGVVSCRTSNGWSAPAFINMTGGSVGLQAGAEHQDVILLMNNQGKQELISGHWELGAEASAAGPTGQSAAAAENTGWKAPVLTYTHSKGAFAGADLGGSKLHVDNDTIHNLYGSNAPLQSILNGETPAPASAQQFLTALQTAAGK